MNILIGIVIIIMGLVGAISPDIIWHLRVGWRVKHGEPSEFALTCYRIGGIIAIIVGLIVIFFL